MQGYPKVDELPQPDVDQDVVDVNPGGGHHVGDVADDDGFPTRGRFDEDPEAAARRELVEETGYRGGKWRELCRAELSNSVTDEVTIMFVATDLEAGEASPEGTEQIQMRWVLFDEAMAMIRLGEIADAMTILGLQQLALERASAAG